MTRESITENQPPERHKPSWRRIMLSTFAAAFGVQSDQNRQHDFQQKSIVPFLVAGVVFTLVFLLALIFIVSMIVDY